MAVSKIAALFFAALTSTTVLAATPTPLASPPDGFSYLGCYTDNDGFRALANQGPGIQGGSNAMTIEACIASCNGEYTYVGLEYYYEVS